MKFEFTDQEIAIIADILRGAPYRVAAPILENMQRQIDAQGAQKEAQAVNTPEEVGTPLKS